MTCAQQRMLYGRTSANRASRFLGEIPEERVEKTGRPSFRESYRSGLEDESEWRPERESYGEGRGYTRSRPYYGGSAARTAPPSPVDRGYTSPAKSATKSAVSFTPMRGAGEVLPDFAKGQMVMHRAFGRGMILTITKMGGDALIEVAFDNVGTKKLMLRSAAQYMEKIEG